MSKIKEDAAKLIMGYQELFKHQQHLFKDGVDLTRLAGLAVIIDVKNSMTKLNEHLETTTEESHRLRLSHDIVELRTIQDLIKKNIIN